MTEENQVHEETLEELAEKDTVKEKKILKDLLPYIVILIVVVLFRTYIATPVRVEGPSMLPTLESNQTLILNKLGKLERFKVVVIKTSDDNLIKRIIALPGEKIEVVNGRIYINDEEVADNFGSGITKDFDAVTLKDDEYFVLGDNRENSTDSRILGPINQKYIAGTATFRLFPLSKVGRVD